MILYHELLGERAKFGQGFTRLLAVLERCGDRYDMLRALGYNKVGKRRIHDLRISERNATVTLPGDESAPCGFWDLMHRTNGAFVVADMSFSTVI